MLNVDTAYAKRTEEIVETLAVCLTFKELTSTAYGLDEMLIRGGVVDEGFERSVGIDVAGGIKRLVQPLANDREDGRDRLTVLLILLGVVADLQ